MATAQDRETRPSTALLGGSSDCLMLRQVFRLPLRQTQGLVNALVKAFDLTIRVPYFSSLSKRGVGLPRHKLSKELETGDTVIVDSTGLKVYGKDEWHQEKHDITARRTWRKLHLAVYENHPIITCELTTPETGDPTAAPDLLDQIDTPFNTFIADGAYDGDPVYRAVLSLQSMAKMVVPPHKTAVCSATGNSQRDGHIKAIEERGRIVWQKQTSYGLRNYAELAVQR